MYKLAIICACSFLFFSTAVFAEPVKTQTTFYGQKISKADEKGLYGKIGLKDGDVIILADDKPLDSPADSMALFNKLSSDKEVKLLITRAGHFEILLTKK